MSKARGEGVPSGPCNTRSCHESAFGERVRYFLDTEFIEDGKTIDLISFALVPDEGYSFYKCNLDCNLGAASPWVREHVLPHLPPFGDKEWAPRAQIRDELLSYLGYPSPVHNELRGLPGSGAPPKESPEFWGYYSDYDWVAFCQLWGRMIDLPEGMPMHCLDVKQLAHELGVRKPKDIGAEQTGGQHDALRDALWTRDYYYKLRALQEQRRVEVR